MKRLILLVTAATVFQAWAFNAPSDTQAGVTLSIAEFPDTSSRTEWNGTRVRKVPTDEPLAFTVTLKNTSKERIRGDVLVWLNDDWTVNASPDVKVADAGGAPVKGDMLVSLSLAPQKAYDSHKVLVALEPGQHASISCTATAKPSVLSALYPVHAVLTCKTAGGEEITLHPIAIFEAVGAVREPPASSREVAISDGVLRLDGIGWRTGYSQGGKVVDLGVGFSGNDPASGTTSVKEPSTRGGIQRAGFAVHPPWRNGWGVAWNDFSLALPKGKPARLAFHTAIRDSHADEPQSDGVEFKVFVTGEDGKEKELFTRFSDAKNWEAASVDLSAYAGQSIMLRLWTGPGPKNNTTCDQSYWGDPVVVVGKQCAPPTEEEWRAREEKAGKLAKAAAKKKPSSTELGFQLKVNGQVFGAAVVLGAQGLTDGVIAFSDGERVLAYRGFLCDVDRAGVGAVENGQPVTGVGADMRGGALTVSHDVKRPESDFVARAKISVDGGALRVAWDMPGVKRDARGTPRFTRLALGPCSEPLWRAYAGFGYVAEEPGAFTLHPGGFSLSTRHVGADYPNGLSLVQASDVFPDRAVHIPGQRRFGIETPHDATFMLVPSTKGAFDAARAYRDICGFPRGRGMDAVEGRMCIDQWGGDYRDAARGLAEAGRYGVNDAVFVKHVWQRWGYDYRLPEIYPPRGDMTAFMEMRDAAKAAGMLFCPHDNYIDFYPDAADFTYDHICFDESGRPIRAWYNKGATAQSYRWLPQAFRPVMEQNMRLMRDGFRPDSLFIDVFTSIRLFDYYDRAGNFYPCTRVAKEWADAFDTCRAILKRGAPMISEGGHDALIGAVDAGQCDHIMPERLFDPMPAAVERTPWHDMATHGKMALFAGGLGPRYAARRGEEHSGDPRHGYGSDDYLSNTVIGGRAPMCDGPFSRRTVMTYWLLHDICKDLAAKPLDTHRFGDTIHQQHTTFGRDANVWANRATNRTWRAAADIELPAYGFYAKTPATTAGIILIDGQRAAFSKSRGAFFADARPPHNLTGRERLETSVKDGRYTGDGTFELTLHFNALDAIDGYRPFMHICNPAVSADGEHIVFQADLRLDPARLARPGAFDAPATIRFPKELPAGTYTVRYGLYRPNGGDRLGIIGTLDGTSRVKGGQLHLEKGPDGFTQGRYASEGLDVTEGLNVDGKILDFGGIATDGAFRLLHSDKKAWQLIPLPGSRAFTATLALDTLGAAKRKVKAIEMTDPANTFTQPPDWKQNANALTLTCDGRAFAYKIIFE